MITNTTYAYLAQRPLCNRQKLLPKPAFGKIKPEHLFVRLEGDVFGKNMNWGNTMANLANRSAKKIKSGVGFYQVLENIEREYRDFFRKGNIVDEIHTKFDNENYFGVKRNPRIPMVQYIVKNNNYASYIDKFTKFLHKNGNKETLYWNEGKQGISPYETTIYRIRAKNMRLGQIKMLQGNLPDDVKKDVGGNILIKIESDVKSGQNGAMSHIKSLYNNLQGKKGKMSLKQINEAIAEIHWFFANSMPYNRGSAGICDILTKSIYESLNIRIRPWKKGISPDLDAFCQTLEDYKKGYAGFFEKTPKFMQNKNTKTSSKPANWHQSSSCRRA